MNRRTLLCGMCTIVLSGCTTKDEETGVIEAVSVEEKPPEAETTPRSEVENTHLREAIKRVCDDGRDDVEIQVTGNEIDAVDAELQEMPGYSPPQGSDYEYGKYVECDGQCVVVRLGILD